MARTRYKGTRSVLSYEQVLQIRRAVAALDYGSTDFGVVEPLSESGLQSAVSRQNTSFEGKFKYQRPHELAASLFYGIAMNHAFENGNKRTALVTCLVSLDYNGLDLVNTSQDDLYEMATQVVSHSFPLRSREIRDVDTEVVALARWLRSRSRKQKRDGDRDMDFRDLKTVLESQGCTFENPSNNYIRITRNGEAVKTGYPRQNFRVGVGEVKKIRRQLGIDGIPSADFYDIDSKVDVFVYEHQDVLSRLAET